MARRSGKRAQAVAAETLVMVPETVPVMPAIPEEKPRFESLDFARGMAIVLMILSHGIKGLLTFEQFPTWGLVPIHLVTKFSSSLFLLVFGICMGAIFLPKVGSETWPETRRRLIIRGLQIFFWYKFLTIVEMFHNYSQAEIINTLTYHAFPSYVEILGFYAIALIWIPYSLSLYKNMHWTLRLATPFAFAYATYYLGQQHWLAAKPALQAILIEHDDYYTWGQLSRAPLIFAGILLGEYLVLPKQERPFKINIPACLAVIGTASLLGFFYVSYPSIGAALKSVALNKGKHPPELGFMLFSVGGALLLLSMALAGGRQLAKAFAPVTALGKDSMGAFIAHIIILFVGYRCMFDLWLKVSYAQALGLAILMIGIVAIWLQFKKWIWAAEE